MENVEILLEEVPASELLQRLRRSPKELILGVQPRRSQVTPASLAGTTGLYHTLSPKSGAAGRKSSTLAGTSQENVTP